MDKINNGIEPELLMRHNRETDQSIGSRGLNKERLKHGLI